MNTTYTTRDEAIQREIIEPLGEHVKDFNIEAIADEVIGSRRVEGRADVEFFVTVNEMEFWHIVQAHEIVPVTVRLGSINDVQLADPEDWTTEVSFDTIYVYRTDVPEMIDAIEVESSEGSDPYDEAIRAAGYTNFTWEH